MKNYHSLLLVKATVCFLAIASRPRQLIHRKRICRSLPLDD